MTILPAPTILIADDHSDFRDALTVLLEHKVTAWWRMRTMAQRHLRICGLRAPVNAVIVDLDMPVMNGWDFVAASRENATWRAISTPVITGVNIAERHPADVGDNTRLSLNHSTSMTLSRPC